MRPVIFDFDSVPAFVSKMLLWRRHVDDDFSIRTQASKLSGCSPALITQVAKGMRRLTRERVEPFSKLLGLTQQETKYLDQWIAYDRRVKPLKENVKKTAQEKSVMHKPKDHILKYWLNPYVKDVCHLAGFQPDPVTIHRLLGGIAPLAKIARSFDFLLREGFLRHSIDGKVVVNEDLVITSDDIPDKRITSFHKRALDLAKRGLDFYPMRLRRSETFVLTVNEENVDELKGIMTEFMDRVEAFERKHANDNERLYQITLHLTPVGGVAVEQMH
jgi:uncharacterized protein (TIGR02147 family)